MANFHEARLAVLIAAPHRAEVSMHRDVAAMYTALMQCGLESADIQCLEGRLDRLLFTNFLESIRRRIATWTEGTLFFYISGHGFFDGESAEKARVGIELQPSDQLTHEFHIFWDEVFDLLAIPNQLKLLLVPDH